MARDGIALLPWGEAPGLHDRVDDEVDSGWPEYNLHGDVLRPRWGRLYDEHPTCQVLAYDERLDRVVGEANSAPCPGTAPRRGSRAASTPWWRVRSTPATS